ncbi:tRNA sulfurtransferase [Halomicrobium sp. LC1Hm]|uniref:tRNA sulfurtransferase n=1 Tax=Halomicrobium sp. LC1Hm TaxID=2610902 RepID=UPI0012983E48|nr:tRNA sulfurtransferase [Halomicrobium sp. LC1Hm]
MHPPGADIVLVRHGEIGTKSEQVRRSMEERLATNLSALLADRGVGGSVERERTRLFVHTDEPGAAVEAATDTFGVVSASAAVRTEPTLDAICEGLAEIARERFDGGTFAVDARRAGQQSAHDFSSEDIESDGGAAVWAAIEAAGGDPAVDLDDPDLTFHVECRREVAYLFLDKQAGPGGLPVGTQEPVVVLLSGGIDSPVAAWKLLKRGCPVVPVYVDLGAYGGPDHRARALSTAETLAGYVPNFDLSVRVADGGDVVERLSAELDARRMLALRRFMLAVGARIAERTDAVGVATGEAIGQKSSQTSANLAVTDAAVDCPVFRPNLTADKAEITQLAREIGTFEASTIPTGCNRVAPSLPETSADLHALREREPDDLFERARAVAERAEVVARDR